MGELDPHDLLIQACRDAPKYPGSCTLLKKKHPRKVLEEYSNYLEEYEATLFSEEKSKTQLRFWVLLPGEIGFTSAITTSVSALKGYLLRGQKDPWFRLVFIESDHSRAPLNCTREMLLLLLTYEQVEPSFLDNVFSFGDRDEAVDTCLSQYYYDDSLLPNARPPAIKALGRSGLEIRETILLRGVERTVAKRLWSIRHLALYVSFDVITGKTLLITVKGNDIMQKRIAEESADLLAAKAGHEDDVAGLFEMLLLTLLLYVRWCEEGWRWFIRDVDEDIKPTLVRARTAPIHVPLAAPRLDPDPGFGPRFRSTLPTNPFVTPAATGVFEKSEPVGLHPLRGNGWLTRTYHGILDYLKTTSNRSRTIQSKVAAMQSSVPAIVGTLDYKDLQKLHVSGQNIEEAILTLHLLIGTLQALAERYQNLMDSGWDDIDDAGQSKLHESRIRGFKAATRRFLTKLRGSIRSLEAKREQLLSLQKRLQEEKALSVKLLQIQNLEASRINAERSRESAAIMQGIAHRTEQETFSMRVLTVVALVFLPPTFVTSFFQSGILEWRETPDITNTWNFRFDAFKLFIAICIPMTAVTFALWFLARARSPQPMRTRSYPEVSSDEREQEGWWRKRRDPSFCLPT